MSSACRAHIEWRTANPPLTSPPFYTFVCLLVPGAYAHHAHHEGATGITPSLGFVFDYPVLWTRQITPSPGPPRVCGRRSAVYEAPEEHTVSFSVFRCVAAWPVFSLWYRWQASSLPAVSGSSLNLEPPSPRVGVRSVNTYMQDLRVIRIA